MGLTGPRPARGMRGLAVFAFGAFGVALLAWLVVGVIDDLQLGRRGVVVTATVEDIRGNDRFHDCLASFAIDGVAYRQWAHAMPGCQVGDRTSIIVDPNERSDLQSTKAYHDRWIIYVIKGVTGLVLCWLAVSIFGAGRRHVQFMAELEANDDTEPPNSPPNSA
jgi:hypothetical protein